MKIEFQHIVYVFILGLAVSLLGFYFKLQDISGGDTLITTGAVLELSGGVVLVIWLLRRFRGR